VLALKLSAVASMHVVLAQSQSLNAALRAASGAPSPALGGDARAGSGSGGGGGGGPPGTPPGGGATPPGGGAERRAAAGAPGGGGAAHHGHAGRSPDDTATQNSASSTLDLAPPVFQHAGGAAARHELLGGAEAYLGLISRWQAAAAATEALVARAAAGAGAAAPGAAPGHAGRVASLLAAVGFEAGMWDLLTVLDTARLACKAVLDMLGPEGGAAPAPGAAAKAAAVPAYG
jgi:hypothetical protein